MSTTTPQQPPATLRPGRPQLDGLGGLPPEYSAERVLTRWQATCGLCFVLALLAFLAWQTSATLIFVFSTSIIIYTVTAVYKVAVTVRAFWESPEIPILPGEIESINEDSLPVYTILLPIYREANMVPHLVASISALDYPKDKLDVKVLLEQDDAETAQALLSFDLPPYFDVCNVPPGRPRGKPRACNFGLQQARGELCTIYDAEDVPEPAQLKKAVLAFAKGGERVACVQAKLSYYNPNQNLLTRWFTSEYSSWFDLVLPGLHAWGAPIPLGGTSNHFQVGILRQLGGWDAFNVTEDADLGVRLYRLGCRTVIIDSATHEEANSDLSNWLRQRSRWIKGYMQTWLVHMRNPVALYRELGAHGFLSFQSLIFGTLFSYMANPVFWIVTAIWYGTKAPAIPELFPSVIFYAGTVSFVAGNLFFIYSHVLGCLRRRQYNLVKYAWTMPLYWLLMSVAFWKAAFQLVTRPHYWEKTLHGLDQLVQSRKGEEG